ncbi:MAG: C-GCAxxG-C-C family protein [bacterium]
MNNTQKIKAALTGGKNCAQIVAGTIAEKFNIDQKTVLAATIGFGGGIGRQGKICGACTGAVVALGLVNEQSGKPSAEVKDITYRQVREFFSKFNEKYDTTECSELLDCDISKAEGFEMHKQGNHVNLCVGFIESALEILDGMLVERE